MAESPALIAELTASPIDVDTDPALKADMAGTCRCCSGDTEICRHRFLLHFRMAAP
jgi:hypothetical protein